MNLGSVLRKLRSKKKLSQWEVAERVGVGQSTYFAWENDRSLPSARYYVKLAAVFDLDPLKLIPANPAGSLPSAGNSDQEPIRQNAQTLYEELTASQKRTILLQQQLIENLQKENHRLREQLAQIGGWPSDQ